MAALGDNARGAVLMMIAMAAFTINDTFMKLILAELPMFQAMALRGIGTSLFFAVIAWQMGALSVGRISGRDRWLIAVRTLAEALAAFFFLMALFRMSLANLTAILQVLPLTITLGAAIFLREPVGWKRLAAIIVGFGGVLLIVRPGTDGFNIYSVSALVSVALVTVRDLVTRRMSGQVPSLLVAFAAAAGVTVLSALASLSEPWVMPSNATIWYILAAKIFIVAGYLLSVMAVRVGEMSYIAPFRYTGLLWALLLGFVVFGDWPDMITIVGAAIVVSTGLYTFARERRLRRAVAVRAPMR
jgi:S-adenosylmethionine uptake transporter